VEVPKIWCTKSVHVSEIVPTSKSLPVQRRPQHHGNLARWRRSRPELAAAGIRYRRNVEVVSIERRPLEAVHITRRKQLLFILLLLLLFICSQFIFRIQHDSPTRRKGRMRQQIARFEKEASVDWRHCEVLAVGQVYNKMRSKSQSSVHGERCKGTWSIPNHRKSVAHVTHTFSLVVD
jgi:hypothetical protein